MFAKTDRAEIVETLDDIHRAIGIAINRRAVNGPAAWSEEKAAMTKMRAPRAQLEDALDAIDSAEAAA